MDYFSNLNIKKPQNLKSRIVKYILFLYAKIMKMITLFAVLG